MKHLLVILCCFLPLFAWADPWDNLSKDEAESLQQVLEKNPYILDYCDCCGVNAHLLEVLSTKIVPSDWDDGKFTVKAEVRFVSVIPVVEERLELRNIRNLEEDEKEELGMRGETREDFTLTMNYIWIYDKNREKAVPLYMVVPYKTLNTIKMNQGSCNAFEDYPKPLDVGDMRYENWYRQNIEKKAKKPVGKKAKKLRKKKR